MAEKKYTVVDEYGRPIEENITLERAEETARLNPGAKIIENEGGKRKRI